MSVVEKHNDKKERPFLLELNASILENKAYKQKIETFWQHWKNKKDSYPDQTKWWDMAKFYIQVITKDYKEKLKKKTKRTSTRV